jgi:hypothetical protein
VDPLGVLNEGASASDVAPRAQALATLTRHAPAEEARSWALRGLFDPDDYTRGRVAAALIQRVDEPWALALLVELVGRADVDPYTRGPAALAIAQAADPGAKDALVRALAAVEEPWRRAPLNLALAVLGDAGALAELSAVLKGGDVPMRVDFIIACGAASGLLFGAIENLLYIHVYFPDAGPELARWRWMVTMPMHAACSTIAAVGVAVMWRRVMREGAPARIADAFPWIVAAMLIHGANNALAILLSVFGVDPGS